MLSGALALLQRFGCNTKKSKKAELLPYVLSSLILVPVLRAVLRSRVALEILYLAPLSIVTKQEPQKTRLGFLAIFRCDISTTS